MPSLDVTQFAGQLPYDAQYVGAYQPFLGWRARSGKDAAQAAAGALAREVAAQVARTAVHRRGREAGGGERRPQVPFGAPRWMRALFAAADPARAAAVVEGVGGDGADGGAARARARPRLPFGFGGGRTEARPAPATTSPAVDLTVPSVAGAPGSWALVPDTAGVATAALAALEAHTAFGTLVAEGVGRLEPAVDVAGWLDELDYRARADAELLLSPIGVLHLYRQLFFDFGTFLGPAVEHIWVAPRSEVELTEEWSRTDYRFRELETLLETTVSTEEEVADTGEFTDELRRETSRDISAGVSASGGVNFPVWQVSGSASFDYTNALRESKASVRRSAREVSAKTASEMKRSTRGLSREVSEVRRSSSRRHRIANPSDQLVSFELRRKLQRVGVQLQHVGTRLCWQLYVDDPGGSIGLAELVHIAAPDDVTTTPPPESAPPALEPVRVDHTFEIPFVARATAGNRDG